MAATIRPLLAQLGGVERASDEQLLARFRTGRDGAAFAALVRRHGPLVWSACRRVLGPGPDAEDAFQATFLALLRKAGTLRDGRSLPAWLSAVAHRVSVSARREADRRRRREQSCAARPSAGPVDLSWREAVAVLHEELDRLPDRYRRPLLLCLLEGKSREDAAALLGWTAGAVKGRLERGREALRRRLERRGIGLSVGLLAIAVAPGVSARVPAALVGAAAGLIRTAGAAPRLGPGRKTVVAGLLLLGLLAAGTAVPARTDPPVPPVEPRPQVAEQAEPTVTVAGRVIDAAGKPVGGAKLLVFDGNGTVPAPQPAAGDDGSFRFTLGPAAPGFTPRSVLASAPGRGCDWAPIKDTAVSVLTLRLPDDVPVSGRVLDLEGRPVAGVTVRLVRLNAPAGNSLDDVLTVWRSDRASLYPRRAFLQFDKALWSESAPSPLPTVTTDAAGRFLFSGLGAERLARLRLHGPGRADEVIDVVLRPGFDPPAPTDNRARLVGPTPTVVLAPEWPIKGVVRERGTGRPLAGTRVSSSRQDPRGFEVETTTDAVGRYHLAGAGRTTYGVHFGPPPGEPFLPRHVGLTDRSGLNLVSLDAELTRGVSVQGRVTDRATGRPVRAWAHWFALATNEAAEKAENWFANGTHTDLDGRFRVAALPGPGVVIVTAGDGTAANRFPPARVAAADRDPRIFDERTGTFRTSHGGLYRVESAYRLIDPRTGTVELTCDFALEPGRRRVGRVLGPDGQPLPGAWAAGLQATYSVPNQLPGAEFTVEGLDPVTPRCVLLWHRERKLSAVVELRGDEPEPVVARMVPCATVTGRGLAAGGKPLEGWAQFYFTAPHDGLNYQPISRDAPLRLDAAGRFRLDGIPAGVKIHVFLSHGQPGELTCDAGEITLAPGEARDLSDLKEKPE